MNPAVRLGAPGDIDGAALVWARATAKRDGKAEIPPLTAAKDVMLDSLRHERSTLVVATNEEVVIGFANAEPTTSSVYADNDAARRLYERMGWTRDEQDPSIHPCTRKPEVRYRLSLGDAPT